MALIVNKINIAKNCMCFVRVVTVIFCLALSIPSFASGTLNEKELQDLITVVRQRYAQTMMQGAEMIKIDGRNVLVAVVGTKKGPSSQRVAQVKAARTAGEFLQAASNKSVTVYEVTDNTSYSIKDKASETGSTLNSATTSVIEQKAEDVTTTETSENFSDSMVQTSFTQVNHIQSLCSLGMSDGEIVYAYYMILK